MKKSRKSRFAVGTIIIVAAFGVLVANSVQSTMVVVPVSELCAADNTPKSRVGQRLRVAGFVGHEKVRNETVRTAAGDVDVKHFTVVEKGRHIAVQYQDALPDTFQAGSPVQVDGVYKTAGLMVAEQVNTKCPSKYEANPEAKKEKKLGEKTAGKQASAPTSGEARPVAKAAKYPA